MKSENIFNILSDLTDKGVEFVLATVVDKQGSGPSESGGKMILTKTGDTYGTIGGGTLERLVQKESKKLFDSRKSVLKKYILDKDNTSPKGENTGMLCGGDVTVFLEYSGAGDKIFLFGGGHVGRNIIRYAEGLKFNLTVVDDRNEILRKLEHPNKIHYKKVDEVFDNTGSMDGSFIIIASHSHELDYKIFKAIVAKGYVPEYLGVVASLKKIDSMVSRLKKEIGREFRTDFLFSPAGLDLGGRSPAEIALSIVSEIQSVKYRKDGLKKLSLKFGDRI